jgi:hypothetical protein
MPCTCILLLLPTFQHLIYLESEGFHAAAARVDLCRAPSRQGLSTPPRLVSQGRKAAGKMLAAMDVLGKVPHARMGLLPASTNT